jgi:hypothetical protein
MEKGQPWLVMQMTGGNMAHWKNSKKFQRWAKELGISFPEIQAKAMTKPRL